MSADTRDRMLGVDEEAMRQHSRMRARLDWFIQKHQPRDDRDRREFVVDITTLMNQIHVEIAEAYGRAHADRLGHLLHSAPLTTLLTPKDSK